MGTAKVRVLCVDDSVDLTRAFEKLIGMQPDLETVGSLPSADDIVAEVKSRKPDVVLMDLTMPGVWPLDAIRELKMQVPACRVVAFSGHNDRETVDAAIDAGALVCISKSVAPLEVLNVIRRAASTPPADSPSIS